MIGLIYFYGISTIEGYLMPNSLCTYMICLGSIWFYGISTIVGYLTPNPFYTKNSSISNNQVQQKYTI